MDARDGDIDDKKERRSNSLAVSPVGMENGIEMQGDVIPVPTVSRGSYISPHQNTAARVTFAEPPVERR